MSQLIGCPQRVEFEHLLSGDLPSDKVEQLASHLEQCPSCVATFADLGGDTLTDALRTTAGASEFDQKKMSILIANCRTATSAVAMGATSGNLRTIDEIPDAKTVEDEIDLSFLSPPQEIGEIGRLDGYRILKLLGVGGMGMVFEAEDIKLKRRVAMKVMKKEIAAKASHRQRFLREAQSAAKVEHDHIVPIYQIGEENGIPFIAMPFLKGEPLDSRLQRNRLDVPESITIARQAAEGLAAAHAHGMIHRDIKPGNIWLETVASSQAAVRVRILDFGLARVTGEQVQLTQTGAIMGTPAYMAPEQARSITIDHRADLFSLGCVMYEMATGNRPFKGHDTMAILASLALDVPEAPIKLNPNLPPQLSALIMSMLEKDPARRPANASVVADTLRQLMTERNVVGKGTSPASSETTTWAGKDAPSSAATMLIPEVSAQDKFESKKPERGVEVKKPGVGVEKRALGKRTLLGATFFGVVALAIATIVIIRDLDDNKMLERQILDQQRPREASDSGKSADRQIEVPWQKQENLKPGATLLPPGKVAKVSAMEVCGTAEVKTSITVLELDEPAVPSLQYKLTGSIKYEGVEGNGHVEMWSQFTDGETCKTIAADGPFEGTSEWRLLCLPIQSEKLPVKIWVNVVLPGKGTVYLSPLYLSAMSADSAPVTQPFSPPSPAKDGFALKFDGQSSYVDLPPSLTLDLTQPFTLEACVNCEFADRDMYILNNMIGGAGVSLRVNLSNQFMGMLPTGAVVPFASTASNLIKPGRHHLALVYDRKALTLYVDGQPSRVTRSGKPDPNPCLAAFRLGSMAAIKGTTPNYPGHYAGTIDAVRLSKSARFDKPFTPDARLATDADTIALYQFDEGQGEVLKDSSGNNHHGKIVGAKWINADGTPIAQAPTPDFALEMNNAASGYPSKPIKNDNLQTTRTVEAYIMVGAGKNKNGSICGFPNGGPYLEVHDGDLRLTGVGLNSFVVSSKPLPVNQRIHIAFVRDGKEIRIYVDGKPQGRQTMKGDSLGTKDTEFMLGYHDNGTFTGLLDEIRISKVARYKENFTPALRFAADADTIALFHCDEGEGALLFDSSGNAHRIKVGNAKWAKADGTALEALPMPKEKK